MKTKLLVVLCFFCSAYYSQKDGPARGSGAGHSDELTAPKKQEKKEPPRERKTSRQAKKSLVPGFKAGVNRSKVFDSQGEAFVADPRWGFAGGMFLAIPLDGFSGLQPEVLISQKGFRSRGSINGDPYTLDRRNTYMDAPLYLQLKPFRFFSVLLGLQYSRLLAQSDIFNYGSNSVIQQHEFEEDVARTNLFGTSFGFDVNISHFVFSYRVNRDLMANKGSGSAYTPRYKNMWIQATVGYRLY